MEAICHLEDVVLGAGGAVVRYGAMSGPGASDDQVTLVRNRQFPLVGAQRPMRVPGWLARLLARDVAVTMMTGRGFCNARASRELGWTLRRPSWRQGFAGGLA
jgi:hypothetical protein